MLNFTVICRRLPPPPPPQSGRPNPVCILLDANSRLCGVTEWHHGTGEPSFAAMLSVSADDDGAVLQLQLRHVDDAYWDSGAESSHIAQLAAMPVLGSASFTVGDARRSAAAAARPFALALALDSSRTDFSELEPCSAFVRVVPTAADAVQYGNRLALQHSCCNFAFGREAAAADLGVSEHMLSTRYGYEVPRATLKMLCHHAMRRASSPPPAVGLARSSAAAAGPAPTPAASEPEPIVTALNALSPAGWAAHGRWLGQALAQLTGAFQHAHGFKPSVRHTPTRSPDPASPAPRPRP